MAGTESGQGNLEQQLLNQDIQDSALSPDELKIIYAARDEILRATQKTNVYANNVDKVADLNDFKIKRLIG